MPITITSVCTSISLLIAATTIVAGCASHRHDGAPPGHPGPPSAGFDHSTVNDWAASICNNPSTPDGKPRGIYTLLRLRPVQFMPLPGASAVSFCSIYAPETQGGCDYDLSIDIGNYSSASARQTDIANFARLNFPMMAYATRAASDTTLWLIGASACVEHPPAQVASNAPEQLAPLEQFGFSISPSPVHTEVSFPGRASTMPSAVPPPAPSTAALPPDADAQGFIGYSGARCNYTNPAIVIARTADSLIVICQTGVGRLYYKGFGLQNNLSVEVADPARTGAAFIASNNGVQYSVSPHELVITQGPTVLSNEAMLTYWSR
ncbi:hypothetical protein [Mycobacterium numidiamassiliense]|uniref:hypothetical protein n=1 Tax=Mycobacterium numidiamassiliense TaxID=1841861 RepID=UPI001054E9DF|nr:hypothetical protein [Mycobacterium numidiamassiliense]